MFNERLRSALTANRTDSHGLAAAVEVDVKTVERWIAGRIPHARHRSAASRHLGRTELHLWPEARPVNDHHADTGEVLAFYGHRTQLAVEDWWWLLTHADEQIDLFAYALLFLPEAHPHLVELLRDKAAAGTIVRVAIAEPAASETIARSIEEGLGPEGMGARVRNTLRHLEPLRGLENINVRQYASPMYNSVFRFDQEMLVTPHLYGTPGYLAPLLYLQRGSAQGPFDQFVGHVDRLWSISSPAWPG